MKTKVKKAGTVDVVYVASGHRRCYPLKRFKKSDWVEYKVYARTNQGGIVRPTAHWCSNQSLTTLSAEWVEFTPNPELASALSKHRRKLAKERLLYSIRHYWNYEVGYILSPRWFQEGDKSMASEKEMMRFGVKTLRAYLLYCHANAEREKLMTIFEWQASQLLPA